MSTDNSQLESELKALRAQELNPEFMDRVESCADGTWTEISGYERHLEQELLHHKPSALPESLMESLMAATKDTPFESNPTIVSFPGSKSSPKTSKTYWWSAAAAVAVMGIMSALMVPLSQPKNIAASPKDPLAPTISANTQGTLVPATFSRDFTEATDEGIIWHDDQKPHRVVKVVYQDRVTMKDANGNTYEVEQPRVEYYMIPTESD